MFLIVEPAPFKKVIFKNKASDLLTEGRAILANAAMTDKENLLKNKPLPSERLKKGQK
tara:strand:- start:441 stop:614 length:174 start_codon:yes stop_codon:yes gene_type:complete